MKKPSVIVAQVVPAFSESDLADIRRETIKSCMNKLGLTKTQAIRWADRTVRSIRHASLFPEFVQRRIVTERHHARLDNPPRQT